MNQISASSYREGPESELLLTGTPLAPAATGRVEVEFQGGRSEVRSDVKDLPEPAALGPFTTYVLWAITPDGRATNLGAIETPLGKGNSTCLSRARNSRCSSRRNRNRITEARSPLIVRWASAQTATPHSKGCPVMLRTIPRAGASRES